MRGVSESRPDVAAALNRLASERHGHVVAPITWFDGFWDFVVSHREHVERGITLGVSGLCDRGNLPWLAFYWESEAGPHVDIMMEARDYRAGSVAPWPVSSIYLDDARPRCPSTLPPRPVDEDDLRELRELGFKFELGYWGIHVSLADVNRLEAELLIRAFDVVSRIGKKVG